jgi:hypothetical protein
LHVNTCELSDEGGLKQSSLRIRQG